MITFDGIHIAAGTASPLVPANVPQKTAARSEPCCLVRPNRILVKKSSILI